MDVFEKKVLVVGGGKSGIAASALLLSQGKQVILCDGNGSLDVQTLTEKVQAEEAALLEAEKAAGIPEKTVGEGSFAVRLGDFAADWEAELSLVVLSPGVPTDLPFVTALAAHLPIWGEVELAYRFARGRIAAITGTNGKTTTTALTGEIMKDYYESVFVVGNIGIPYTSTAALTRPDSVTVAEISSFQLETIDTFHPQVSAILNITPDHLNRHHTMENYIKAKEDITKNQGTADACVLNYEDEVLRAFGQTLKTRVIWFSGVQPLEEGLWFDGKSIFIRRDGQTEKVCDISELNLLGRHNHENVMAAVAISLELGVPMDSIRGTLRRFTAVEHRIEFVAEKNGVAYYNDSKGTNPDAAIKGIQAMTRPTWLIGGGYDKNSEYEEWIQAFDGKVKGLVLIGATREKIRAAAERCGFTACAYADSLEEAITWCKDRAQPGDAVLLSPACASWGMFKNYEERGKVFKDFVKSI